MQGEINILTCVNAVEVIARVMKKTTLGYEGSVAALRALDVHWWEPTEAEALRAAELSTIKDLALGDRFCIALGELRREPLITADQYWASLTLRTPVHLIR